MEYEQKPDPVLLALLSRTDQARNGSIKTLTPPNKGLISDKHQKTIKTEPFYQSLASASTDWTGLNTAPNNKPQIPLPPHEDPTKAPFSQEKRPTQVMTKYSTYWIGPNTAPNNKPQITLPPHKDPTKAPFSHEKRATQVMNKYLPKPGTTPKGPWSVAKRKAEHFQAPSNKKVVALNNPFFCELCQISCSGTITMKHHMIGRHHKAKMEYKKTSGSGKPRCDVCEIWCTDRDALELHLKGQKHNGRVREVESNGGEREFKTAIIMCDLCHVPCMNQDLYKQHLKGKKHAWGEAKREANLI